MDVVVLSRIQFALTSAFHYIYPPLSIGLGLMLVIMEGFYMKTKNPLYKKLAQFWTKVFGLTFALGVATGLVQLFGFGTNWARYSRFVGDVFGSALAAEGVFAFFLEGGFIGLALFGWERVSARIHYLATILVALGAHFSAIWIVVANSWMQTPAGFAIVGEGLDAKAVVTDFWQMVFNPSSITRLTHVLLGCWLSGIFLVLSVGSYYLLKNRHHLFAKACVRLGLICAPIVLGLQLISADDTARGVAKYQPIKLAAMEGIYETKPYTPFNIMGWVDTKNETVSSVQIPGGLSYLTYRDFKTPVRGLKEFPRDEWPNISAVFQMYHLMILMWGLMVVCVIWALILWKKGKLQNAKWTLRALVCAVLLPQIANQAGWVTAEMGRQPWVVYKLLRTSQGVSPAIASGQVIGSIFMFIVIYILLLALFLFLLDQKIKHGPEEELPSEYRDPYVTQESL